jgi:CheY-like chemotaxis protein
MKCPKCSATFSGKPDEIGLLTCSNCGARLRSKTTAVFKAKGVPKPTTNPLTASESASALEKDSVLARAEGRKPDADDTVPKMDPDATVMHQDPDATVMHRDPDATVMHRDPDATLMHQDVDGTLPKGAASPAAAGAAPGEAIEVTLEMVHAELRAIRSAQAEILAILKGRTPRLAGGRRAAESQSALAMVGRILIVDDDPATRAAAADAVGAVIGFQVTTAADGNDALAAIAMERPDVVVLEIDLGGSLPGKDVVAAIRGNTEWEATPIVLFTRAAVAGDDEAKTEYRADHVVPKGPTGAETLTARVRTIVQNLKA